MASSADSNGYSSDEEVLRPVVKRKKKPKTIISTSESEDEDSDIEIKPKIIGKPLRCKSEDENCDKEIASCGSTTRNGAETSNDLNESDQAEKCAICLSKFLGQDIATPETCDHVFCLECLQEWAKNVNTCPIDRLKFNLILIRHHKEEKIIKTIIINNSTLPSYSDSETESVSQTLEPLVHDLSSSAFRLYRSSGGRRANSAIDCCDFCGRDKNEAPTLRCHECRKIYHLYCVSSSLENSASDPWKCPACSIDNEWERHYRGLPYSAFRPYHALSGSRRTHSPTNSSIRSKRSVSREFKRLRRGFLYLETFFRRSLSSSDSSDEETDHRSVPSRLYQPPVISSVTKSRCPLLGKRRNEICRTRNQALVSAAASAAPESRSLYTGDSDEGLNDYRVISTPVPENFDVVGSILESQTLLHCPDVLTLRRDGTLVRSSKSESSSRRLPTYPLSPVQNSEDSSQSSFLNSSSFNDNAISPFLSTVVAKQRPLHPTQNNSTKYSDTPMQAYSCSSAGAPMERSINYDDNTTTRPSVGSNSNERFENDPYSSIIQRNFCGASAPDDIKKDGRASKSHHSEDEVDIYSDIESVGEEDGEINERVESMKIHYKCDDSQMSNPNDGSDSSDNDLVIDEDQQIEEENDKIKEHQESVCSSLQINNNDSQITCEESDVSSNIASDDDQLMIDTNPQNTNNSYVDNSNDGYKPSDDSSQEAFQNNKSNLARSGKGKESASKNESDSEAEESNHSKSVVEKESASKNESDSEADESDHSKSGMEKENISKNESDSDAEESNHSKSGVEKEDISKNESDSDADESNHSKSGVEKENISKNESDSDADESNHSKSGVEKENASKNELDSDVDESSHSKLLVDKENITKNDSDSDADRESDVDMQEDEENSVDSAKKSYQGDMSSSLKSSPKSCKGEPTDRFEMQCENSVSNENSGCDNNSCYEEEESKEIFEEASSMGNENTCDSVSQAEEAENFNSGNNSNTSDQVSQVEANENSQMDNNSNFSFTSDQQNADNSETDTLNDSKVNQENEQHTENSELVDICNDITMKSDDEDNVDSLENASTPCLDENLEGQIENSPVHNQNYDGEGQEFESLSPKNECNRKEDEVAEEERDEIGETRSPNAENLQKNPPEGDVDLGIEDISEAGSDEIGDEFPDGPATNNGETELDDVEQKVARLFSPDNDMDNELLQKSGDYNKHTPPHSNQSYEDHEEGEIIEERPVHRCKKKKDRFREDSGDYGDFGPRINISDLPRIPKLKRDRDKESIPETITFENKRTSVLSRVDLGGDISWKRLSKHTRERSYRDGRPKDERLLYRERESRNKDKSDSGRKSDSKNSERRREEKKLESEKSRSDYDSRSRKSEKNRSSDWNYSDREKRKSRKEKHSKDKHSKEKKDKHDKNKYSKDEDKYEREKLKEDMRYEREMRYEKEERFERIVYEKSKFKDKEHKSKHKDRKSESSKSSKDHSRDKHKHTHSSDHFTDKQREREVRKIDDKLKIVVEQKESRKEKSKHKERKETKHEKKQVVQRKIENERSPYSELTSIESKEIFAKGDSIIINVNFNRASSPKVSATPDGGDSEVKDKKVLSENMELGEPITSDEIKTKTKHSSEKNKNLDNSICKRPVTPPEKNPVLSVSECYWQGVDDPDSNHTPASEKSEEEALAENEIETGSANGFDTNNFSNSSSSSPEILNAPSASKDSNSIAEEPSFMSDKEASNAKESENFISKRRSPRSPSPPSPADNDSYDPCEPTKSPSPPPMPPAPPLPSLNPKPPPSPELPPLPPEPEPIDARDDSRSHKQNTLSEFVSVSTAVVSSACQPNTVHTQTSMASPSISVQSMLLPPPSFMSHVSSAGTNLPGISPLVARNGGFQMGSHTTVMLPANHVQQVMGGTFLPHMPGASTLPPPPNPPNMAHMSSVPPPPPPPAGMTLLSQARHPRLNLQPPLTPTSLLQSLTMAHTMTAPPMQMIHHLPPNISGILANHQSPIVCSTQNQPTSLPVSIANQQVSRLVFSQNQLLNHNALMQNQNISDNNKSQGSSVNLMSSYIQSVATSSSSQQKTDKHSKPSPSAEKNEVVDMEVDTPYSPGDSPSVDNSPADYSPATSPVPSSPRTKDIFDSLFSADQRTSEKRTHDAMEKSKHHAGSKKSKHEHKSDSKGRHSVRMQVKDKFKKTRKEHKTAEKKDTLTKLEDSQLKILDELPSSAVEMQVKEKFLKKLNRQERVVEEVKLALKPYYKSRDVTKEEYKDILRKSVPKICHNKSGEINPVKVKNLVESYVKKAKHSRKRGDKKKSSKFS